VRLRLTVLYAVLFLASGAGLLAITYTLLSHQSSQGAVEHLVVAPGDTQVSGPGFLGNPPPIEALLRSKGCALTIHVPNPEPGVEVIQRGIITPASCPQSIVKLLALTRQKLAFASNVQAVVKSVTLHQLFVQSLFVLAAMALVAFWLGWWASGKVLAPLRTMTATTRQITEDNLHQRLALGGPNDELRDLSETIDGLLDRLEAAFESQRNFVANASHELRTPLAIMRASVDVAMAKPDPPPPAAVALASRVREGLDQVERLLESFLALARTQRGQIGQRTEMSLASVVSAAVEAQQPAIALMHLSVEEDTTSDAWVQGNETLITRMVHNLVDNAIRHNQPDGWLHTSTGARGGSARLVVENGGPILDPEEVRQLAQPFRRLGAQRVGSDQGVGLGLSIVAAIVSAHGGNLSFVARAEGGLRVTIELPLVSPPVRVGVAG
jgi:signal transduction histidine kinase